MIDCLYNTDRYLIRVTVSDKMEGRHYAEMPKDEVEDIGKRASRRIRSDITRLLKRDPDAPGHRNTETRYRFLAERYQVTVTVTGKRGCKHMPPTCDVDVLVSSAARMVHTQIVEWIENRKAKGGNFKRW